MLIGLSLCGSCAGTHSCCEFMSTVVLPCPEDTVFALMVRRKWGQGWSVWGLLLFPGLVLMRWGKCGRKSRPLICLNCLCTVWWKCEWRGGRVGISYGSNQVLESGGSVFNFFSISFSSISFFKIKFLLRNSQHWLFIVNICMSLWVYIVLKYWKWELFYMLLCTLFHLNLIRAVPVSIYVSHHSLEVHYAGQPVGWMCS